MKKKKIVILGSTGSIGESAFKVAEHLPDELEVVGVAAFSSIKRLSEQVRRLGCSMAAVGDEKSYHKLKGLLPPSCKAYSGQSGMIDMITSPEVDIVLCAIVGTAGLIPVLHAIKAGKTIAIASKEVLVMAGEIVMREAAKAKVKLIPVDSEHSAIFQCIEGKKHKDISRLILTASGGPFRNMPLAEMHKVSYEQALNHPTWNMGPKVTIDSATLMNKALEVIEARWLFDVKGKFIDVVLHPESVIHSMVEFIDGTILAQMSSPDMRFPIQYALTYPNKHRGSLEPLDFRKFSKLTFEMPDNKRFPSLDFAHWALNSGGTLPAVMNAANEIAFNKFRQAEIKFTDIWKLIEKVMDMHQCVNSPSIEDIFAADNWARCKAEELCSTRFTLKS